MRKILLSTVYFISILLISCGGSAEGEGGGGTMTVTASYGTGLHPLGSRIVCFSSRDSGVNRRHILRTPIF